MSTVKADRNVSVPATWDVRPLGKVVRPTRPRIKPSEKPDLPFIGMENIEAHTMKLLGTVPAGTMKSSAVHFQSDDVLYGRLRPYLNKVYRPGFEGLCSAEFIVFPKTEGISSRYLQYFLNSFSFASYATHLNAGDRPRVDFEQLSPYPFPVAPYEQQKRIVAEIEKQFSRLDEAVANLKRVKANLKRYKAAVLKAAVEGCLTRMKVGGSQQHEVTRGWRQATVGEAIQIIDYRGRTPPFSNSGIPHLRSSNIKGGRIVWENLAYVTGQTYDAYMTRGLPQEGDVLFTTEAPLGEVALAPKEKFSVAQRMMILRPKPELLNSRFLMVQLMSPQFHAKLRHRGTGSTVTGVSSRNFQPFPLLIPPIEEQEGIADEVDRRLSVIEELEAAVQANLVRADRLRQSILRQAFSGKLVGAST